MSLSSLHTGYSGLAAAQLAIDTAAHNVANANTDGFTRQRVSQSASIARNVSVAQVGTGVSVDDITRSRDAFLDSRVRGALSSKGSLEVRSDLLSRAEGILGEPDFGISNALDDLWATFEDLSLDATDPGRRLGVLASLSATTNRFNTIAEGFQALSDDASSRVSSNLNSVNALLDEVAELNSAITLSASTGTTPNDLLDRRDQKLDAIAEAIGAHITTDRTGKSRVTLNGLALVDGTSANHLAWDQATQLLNHTTGFALKAGGTLGGLQAFVTSDLPAVRASFDTLAIDLANALNTAHKAGFSSTGVAGTDLVSYNVSNPAGTIKAIITDPALLAPSDDGSSPFPIHNGENAVRLSELRESLSAGGGTQSLLGAARAFVTNIGASTASATRAARTQKDLADAADLSRAGSHGVNIDEEMINLIRYQRAFEAAARVITTADQALDTLINRTGIVGR